MADLFQLLTGTLSLRPYVFGFLAVYLLAAFRDLGGWRAVAFTGWAWAVAFAAEYASTRTGIPFGLYHYTESTRGQELYLANVPFMDSLSFAFLAYASFSLARLVTGRSRGLRVMALSGLLMMLLDVVIDPLAVRGDRWFLGRIFYYPEGGVYFGVPLANFFGWAVVGWVIVGAFSAVFAAAPPRSRPLAGAALYYGVLIFNLAVTWWIGEPLLLAAGIFLHAATALLLWRGRIFAPLIRLSRLSSAPPMPSAWVPGLRRTQASGPGTRPARATLGGGIGRGGYPRP